MAEYKPPISACTLALQECDFNTKCKVSDVLHDSIDTPCDRSSSAEPEVDRDMILRTSKSNCTGQIPEHLKNGDLLCNGKSHMYNTAVSMGSEVLSAENESVDVTSNLKKLNGLNVYKNDLSFIDGIANDIDLHRETNDVDIQSNHVCDIDITSNVLDTKPSQKISHYCDVSLKSEIEQEKTNCDSEKNNFKDNEIDNLLDKLENVSVQSSNSCINVCENENKDDSEENCRHGIEYVVYESERQMPDIMRLITKDLSEPYSIYTYRYFIHNWPRLCFLAKADDKCVGAIVCKLDLHKKMARRGYIAMLAVDSEYRRRQIGSTLVTKAIAAMIQDDCDEVVLETEITNRGALRLYENMGFVRDKRLFRYYLNGVDALRLKLWLR
ncbi:N-alpha-acetyltransferase 30 [Plakobranchus ocellatus]|uniref:N-terminal methionine N(alpha)-acetyltransferase NatC n=1 Tax=Plakobranchus ocellatus TaxID=259542 RepID=A0AAV4A2N7_9GAST|nr:N-alpha-acetyltransferase 30 [Plakobranchus ocellatus]